MKPYSKTYRCYKDHKATECGLCAERVENDGKTVMRQEAKQEILKEIENG